MWEALLPSAFSPTFVPLESMTAASSKPPTNASPPGDPNSIKVHNWADANDPINDETRLVRYRTSESCRSLK